MDYFPSFTKVLQSEADALLLAKSRVSEDQVEKLIEIYRFLQKTGGRLAVCGVGKSGIIGQKICATFNSLGLSSYFLHPVEALHGDLGSVSDSDAIILISKSGTTKELAELLPFLKIPENLRIGLMGHLEGDLALKCGVVFDCRVEKEACLNNQAPTCSSTVALAFGDAMAVVYEQLVGLSKESFAYNHPGGLLGKSMHLRVGDILLSVKDCAVVNPNEPLEQVIVKMTQFPTGACAVVDKENKLLGIIAEGDIRRALIQGPEVLKSSAEGVMTKNPISIGPEKLALDALDLMENRKNQLNILPVIGDETFQGFLRLHDLLKHGFSK